MKRSRYLNFVLAAVVGLMTGLPTTGIADDTEIYLGNSVTQQGVRPNVLFILDTSGSMNANVEGTGLDRLDNMKAALNTILDSASNINVGLMRFTDPGGPILFPVSYIDGDATQLVKVGMDVNSRVSASDDDAEEEVATGSMDLTSDQLELIEVAAGAGAQTFKTQVASQANNAEEQSDGVTNTGSRIDLRQGQVNGVRFNNVPIPTGATITDARVVFIAYGSDSSTPEFTLYGDANPNAAVFIPDGASFNVSARTKTAASVVWNPPSWSTNEESSGTTTPNLAAIVQEIVDAPGWASGNNIAFIQEHTGSGGQRLAYTHEGSSSKAAKFQVSFTTAAGGNQVVGLRFQQVGIPQGATITQAFIEFHPAVTTTAATNVNVSAEDVGDAQGFGSLDFDISGRTKTAANVNWNVPSWDDVDSAEQTDDLSAVVQEVVDRTDWCGNNAIAFIIEPQGAVGPRIAESFDGDPSRAPILRVEYDESTVSPSACVISTVQRQVFATRDDAEQNTGDDSVSTSGNSFDMNSNQVNGLRFRDIPILGGSTVVDAELVFTARSVDTGSVTFTLKGEAADDADEFGASNDDIDARPRTTASVSWTPEDWDTAGIKHVSADIGPVIQEILNRPGWVAGNDLVIIQEHASGGARRARTFDHSPIDSPVLRIRVQGANATVTKTVRAELKELVDELDHIGHTPIVDTLYEAARYFRGDDVHWGKSRGDERDPDNGKNFNADSTNDSVRRNTRISHPASWQGGTVHRPDGCTDADLTAEECADPDSTAFSDDAEHIDGSPVYVSPITETCQANYVVLLTDGSANHNDSAGLIKSYIPTSTCLGNVNEECARDLVKWMNENDQVSTLPDDQTVTTYTIGFNFSSDFLTDLATDGGGSFHTANTAAQLAEVFQNIIADILARSTSFAAPTISINAFNRLFNQNDVYFSLFKPVRRISWEGNVKRYQLCDEDPSDPDSCTLGTLLDANGNVAVGANGAIADSAVSFWTGGADSPDGSDIIKGGAAKEIPAHASRTVLTYAETATPVNIALDVAGNRLLDINDDGIIDDLTDADPEQRTKDLLGDSAGLLSAAERSELINWIRGQDVDDEDEDASTTDNRYAFNDPLHSSPLPVTFGGTTDDPIVKLFVGTNDGGLRMINAADGEEEWIFYPQRTLSLQKELRANPNGNHRYGLDGTPTVWRFDDDGDGVIEPTDGDFVRIFVGMRRGGDSLYAFDVTPSVTLTDPLDHSGISPTLLWRIDGPDAGGTEFPRLGETWSQPRLAKVLLGTGTAGNVTSKTVLVFAGGYDTAQDGGFGVGGLGNAIYVADAETGNRLVSVSSNDPGSGNRVVVADMVYPIPSDVSILDTTGDGFVNRLYVGDTGGQMWRVDFKPDLSSSPGINPVVGKLATVSSDADAEDQRKFFYPPSTVQVLSDEFSTVARYDLVSAVTGNRAHPLDDTVQDRIYAFRDQAVDFMLDVNDDGLADVVDVNPADGIPDAGSYPTLQGKITSDSGDLFDVTDINVSSEDETDQDLLDLQAANGWFLDLPDSGEKGLARPLTIGGTLFFTTYLPEGVQTDTSCALGEGGGRLYGVDVLSGAAVFNWDDADGTDTITPSDKSYSLGNGGIPGPPGLFFTEYGIVGLVPIGDRLETFDPGAGNAPERSYWFEQLNHQ